MSPSLLLPQLSKRVRKVWKPQLFQRELYSEILDKRFTVTVTMRTLDLIDQACGFDFYILKARTAGSPLRCHRHPVPPTPTAPVGVRRCGSRPASPPLLSDLSLFWPPGAGLAWVLPAAGVEAEGGGGRDPA